MIKINQNFKETKPLPLFSKKKDPNTLSAGRYGTEEMVKIWGEESTFDYQLKIQGLSSRVLSNLYPLIVPKEYANEIQEKASIKTVDPNRIRYWEDKTGHDIIGLNNGLSEVLSKEAKTHINKTKTSADTTEPAKALQIKESLEIIVNSTENLRDIVIEKSLLWKDKPFMDQTHLYDALPTVAGRPLAHYAEMLQSNLNFIKYVYENSLMGKWADATGNHHSAKLLGIDGKKVEQEFCKRLGLNRMIAPSQVPGLEFQADVIYAITRLSETIGNIADFIAVGRGDDRNVFVYSNPKKQKGSSAMPHKDSKNGNPTVEEQDLSITNYMRGVMTTALSNCRMPYARNLAASANMRILLEDSFKFLDQGIRKLASVVYWIDLKEEESLQRIERSYGCSTSQAIMTYLTDNRFVENPLPRNEAHDLLANLATSAWKNKTQLYDVLKENEEITSRIENNKLRELSNPINYIGESKNIILEVANKYHKKKTL